MEFILSFIDSILYNSLGFVFVALGILITIRFTGFPDLTIDGSFTLGAAIYTLCLVKDIPVFIAFFLGSLAGSLAGFLTAFINKILGIGKIMSGIIVMILSILLVPYFGINSTISLLKVNHFFNSVNEIDIFLTNEFNSDLNFSFHFLFSAFFLIFFIVVWIILRYFFSKDKTGIRLRYIGAAKVPGLIAKKKRTRFTFLGLGLGNMLIAIGGIIEAERKGGFSQNMGQGILLIGIAILVLGESILRAYKKRIYLRVDEYLLAVFLGTLTYSCGIQLILSISSTSSIDLRLSSTILLLILMTYSSIKFPNSEQLF